MGERVAARPLDWRFYLYNTLLLLASPLLLLYLLYRMVIKGKSRQGFSARLGSIPPEAAELASHNDPVFWFQACSVGEVAAVQPIIHAVREREPLAHIVLSTTTPTGREMALKRELELDALIYFPFDIPFCIRRVINGMKPDILVMVDTELWPNIVAIARSAGLVTALVNGRISDKAYPRDRMAAPLMAWTLSNFSAIMAQSPKDAERFVSLGAAPEQVSTLGNCKFDEPMPDVSAAEANKLRLELGLAPEAPILVAGSTREGEDEKVLEAYDLLRQDHRDLQLVIAPRHPERGDAIERLVTERGYAAYRRSRAIQDTEAERARVASGQVRVVILDTIGELTRVYALATVVFVGGSLVRWGGHNILQPIALGKPTLMGPWMHNFQDITDIALGEQAAVQVFSAEQLAEEAGAILASPAEQELLAARGAAMLQRHGGASARYAEALVALLREARGEMGAPS